MGGIMVRIFFFLLGFGLMTMGFIYIILYLNLLSIGYNFHDYVKYILGHIECYFSLVGLIMINIVIYLKGDNYGIWI